jgi:hypothetical protein
MKKEAVPRKSPVIIIRRVYKNSFPDNFPFPNKIKKVGTKAVAVNELNRRKRIALRADSGVLERSKNPNDAEIAPSDKDERMKKNLRALIFLSSKVLIPGRRINPIARKERADGI